MDTSDITSPPIAGVLLFEVEPSVPVTLTRPGPSALAWNLSVCWPCARNTDSGTVSAAGSEAVSLTSAPSTSAGSARMMVYVAESPAAIGVDGPTIEPTSVSSIMQNDEM